MEARKEYTKPTVERVSLKPQESVLICTADISTCNDGAWPLNFMPDSST